MSALRIVLTIACLSGACGTGFAQRAACGSAPGAQPYELVRRLSAVQDRIVLGDREARASLPNMIPEIADRLSACEASAWADPRNDRALVAYTLSGGQPRVVRKALQSGTAPQAETTLMSGALAYAEGSEAKAKQTLLQIDPASLSPSLAGLAALAQAALLAKSDRERATRLLDQARLLAPGTLVEEAALRRSALLANEGGDFTRFAASSSHYLRRYSKSLYAEEFRRGFAEAAVRFGLADYRVLRGKLAGLLNELGAQQQVDVYLLIARRGLLEGKIEAAKFAAEAAVPLSREPRDSARAKFYVAAANILSAAPADGLHDLAGVDGALLSPRDRELRSVVAGLAGQIQKAEDPAPPRADAGSAAQTPEPEPADSPAAKLALEAEQSLRRTDALLGSAR